MTCSGRTEWASVHRDACEQLFAGGGASRLNPWRRSSVAKWCLWSWTVSAYWDVPRHTPRLHLEPRGDRMHIDLLCHNHVLKRRRHKARISETPGNNLPSFILTLSGRVAATDECLLRELDPRCHGQTKKMWGTKQYPTGYQHASWCSVWGEFSQMNSLCLSQLMGSESHHQAWSENLVCNS